MRFIGCVYFSFGARFRPEDRKGDTMINIEPTGVVFTGVCDIQTEKCTARTTAPLTAVWSPPGRTQVNVCGACLQEMVRYGEWYVKGARIVRQPGTETALG